MEGLRAVYVVRTSLAYMYFEQLMCLSKFVVAQIHIEFL